MGFKLTNMEKIVINHSKRMKTLAKKLGIELKDRTVCVEVVDRQKVTESYSRPIYEVVGDDPVGMCKPMRKRKYMSTITGASLQWSKAQIRSQVGSGNPFEVVTPKRLDFEREQKRCVPHVERKL